LYSKQSETRGRNEKPILNPDEDNYRR